MLGSLLIAFAGQSTVLKNSYGDFLPPTFLGRKAPREPFGKAGGEPGRAPRFVPTWFCFQEGLGAQWSGRCSRADLERKGGV